MRHDGWFERLIAIRKNAASLKRASAGDATDYKACADAYASIAEPSAEDAYSHAGCPRKQDSAMLRSTVAVLGRS